MGSNPTSGTMKYRRKKSRRHVKCVLCTDNRDGNSEANLRMVDWKNHLNAKEQVEEIEYGTI